MTFISKSHIYSAGEPGIPQCHLRASGKGLIPGRTKKGQ